MPHTPAPAFAHTRGPRDAQVVIVGEAWGDTEELTGKPFMGTSGQELTRLLREAGLRPESCLLTNTFAFRPPGKSIDAICGPKATTGVGYTMPPMRQGKYILPEFLPELTRLTAELTAAPRNLVIAMGGTATWALLHNPRISGIRGATAECLLTPGLKVLPTYHPAYVLRMWQHRPIVLADLMKASREALFPEIRRPTRTVLVSPTLDEIAEWARRPAVGYAVDIETTARQIRSIGFARSPRDAIVIPFVDMTVPGNSHWPTAEAELQAWRHVKAMLEDESKFKIFQNGLFDLQYLIRQGMRPVHCIEDTMLKHHSMYPEMQKGLGFLGSVYTNEASWKLMRGKAEELKRDE